jgi:hypothetical protein
MSIDDRPKREPLLPKWIKIVGMILRKGKVKLGNGHTKGIHGARYVSLDCLRQEERSQHQSELCELVLDFESVRIEEANGARSVARRVSHLPKLVSLVHRFYEFMNNLLRWISSSNNDLFIYTVSDIL